MATISTLAVNLIARTSVFERNMKKSRKTAKSFRKTLNNVGRSALKMGKILRSGVFGSLNLLSAGLKKITRLAKLTAIALVGIGIASVKIASDVVETDNLFKISMGSMSKQAAKFAKVYSKSLGLFELDTRKTVGTFQLILTSMGLTEKQAFEMSKGLVKLRNDISSFRNLKPEAVFEKLQGGITGEIRPLRNIGILINETVLKNLALEKGILKTNKAVRSSNVLMSKQINGVVKVNKVLKNQTRVLTDTEKVLLRYEAIVRATTRDTGDMARTLDDTANVFRVIMAQIKITGATIGKVLLPMVTKVAIAFRDWLTNNQALFEKWANKTVSAIEIVIARLRVYFAMAKAGRFDLIFKDIGRIFGSISKGLVELFERVKPIAVTLGKQIASGFLESIADTKLSKALDIAGKVTDVALGPLKLTSAIAGEVAAQFVVPKAARARAFPDRDVVSPEQGSEIVQELKKITANTSDGGPF